MHIEAGWDIELGCPENSTDPNFFACTKKVIDRERCDQEVLPGFLIVIVIEPSLLHSRLARKIKQPASYACAFIGSEKGAIFTLISFFESFCIYYIPHNYVIPQAMPHAIPQTDSAFYPHRLQQ